MRFTIFFTSFLFLCFFSSCNEQEDSIKEATIFENYFIRYLAPEQQIKAQVVFSEGDTIINTLPKSFTGGVSFLGSGMARRKISDQLIRFEDTRKIPYPKTSVFKYRNDEGVNTSFTIKMSPIESFLLQSNASKSKGMDILIKGELLDSHQSLVFLFSDKNNIATSIEIKGPTSTPTLHLPPAKFSTLSTGTGKLYLVKKQFIKEKIKNREIVSAIEYYTKDIEIEIEN